MDAVLTAGRPAWPGRMERLAAWLRGWGNARRSEAPLRIEARLSLGAKKSLVLVNCRGRQLLLALSGDAVAPVLELVTPRAGRGPGAGR